MGELSIWEDMARIIPCSTRGCRGRAYRDNGKCALHQPGREKKETDHADQ
ncbi:hypothetical protein vBCbaSRXM_63 [Citromicrobium phage vB_CbaS-RXM]|nr:hypothetical protein vBCbaSRXM_63 [Citromicrobium phage vB_CbaS-RXM]